MPVVEPGFPAGGCMSTTLSSKLHENGDKWAEGVHPKYFPCPPLSGNFSEHWIINFVWFAKNSIWIFLFHAKWNFHYNCFWFHLVFVHGLICMPQKYTKQVRPSGEWIAMGPIVDRLLWKHYLPLAVGNKSKQNQSEVIAETKLNWFAC